MTNKEAINILEHARLMSGYPAQIKFSFNAEGREALEMAIKALEQQPSEDCISRKQTLKVFAEECAGECACCEYNGSGYSTAENCKLIKSLPSVTPQQTTWIPLNVKGNEPKEEGHYLLYFDYGYVTVFYYDGRNEDLWADAIAYMPLPEPYVESEVNADDE